MITCLSYHNRGQKEHEMEGLQNATCCDDQHNVLCFSFDLDAIFAENCLMLFNAILAI